MRAFVCEREPRLIRDRAEPSRVPGEALIRTRLAGICHTDVELSRGYLGFCGVLGHEFVGEVVATDTPGLAGRRVVADINAGCGACDDCLTGMGHHCPKRTVLGIVGRDGALADLFTIPERCIVAVPDSLPDDAAVFAEPLAAALHVLDDLPVSTDPVVVLGDGKLGQLVARALVAAGRPAVLVGHHADKLALARAAGVSTLVESDVGTSLDGSPAVIEATGRAAGVALALRLTRPRGTVVLKTTVAGPTTVDLSPVVIHELRVVGSRCGDLTRAIDVLAAGRIDPTPLIAARYTLDQAEEALRHASRPGALKVLVSRNE